jgi:hypothetical protein
MPDNPVTNILSTQRNPAPLNIHASVALHCILECYLYNTLKLEHEPASSQSRRSILRALKRAISSPGRRLQTSTLPSGGRYRACQIRRSTLKTDREVLTCLLMAKRVREKAAATKTRVAYPRDLWNRTILFFKTELR